MTQIERKGERSKEKECTKGDGLITCCLSRVLVEVAIQPETELDVNECLVKANSDRESARLLADVGSGTI